MLFIEHATTGTEGPDTNNKELFVVFDKAITVVSATSFNPLLANEVVEKKKINEHRNSRSDALTVVFNKTKSLLFIAAK